MMIRQINKDKEKKIQGFLARDENNSNNVQLNNIPLPTFTQGVEFTATTTTVTDAPCSSMALVQDSNALGTGIFKIQ